MNKLTTTIIGVVAAIALIASFTYDQSPKLITGAQGPQGPKGEQGMQGPAGQDGKDGVTTVITKTEAPKFGAVSGFDSARAYLNSGMTAGGSAATTSTATAYTLNARDFIGTPSTILWTPNVNTTLSLSATSTFDYVPKVGDVARIMFLNASSTAASSVTFAAVDAGIDLQFSEATGGDLVLNGLDWAELVLIRTSLHKTAVIFDEFTEAD